MKWFRKSEPVYYCAECQLAYTRAYREADFIEYCRQCAAPRIDKKRRQAVVQGWAAANWEALESQAKEWVEKNSAKHLSSFAEHGGAAAQYQQSALAAQQAHAMRGLYTVGPLFGGQW